MNYYLFILGHEWETCVLGVYAESFSAQEMKYPATIRLIMVKNTTACKDNLKQRR